MERRKTKLRYTVIAVITISALGILSAVGIAQYKRAETLALAVENQYVHAFHELTDYVNDVDVLLKKSMLVSSPRQLSTLSANLYMQTAAAKANLAQLPLAELDLSGTSKFLSQAGDYASYLSAKVIDSNTINDEEYENLASLSDYCQTVRSHLEGLRSRLYEGDFSLNSVTNLTAHAEEETPFETDMATLEKEFQDYPSLIYDGPFSEHIQMAQPKMLQDRPTFSKEDALHAAQNFLGDERSKNLSFTDKGNGTIKTYNFSSRKEDREISISITEQGGYIYYFLDNRKVSKENLSPDEAIKKAAMFLQTKGFTGMINSYYEKSGGTATINFAATQNGVILYSDLIKVKVALDNGEILGLETGGYLMAHILREISPPQLDMAEATKKINPHLSIDSVRLALIPLDSRREVLCYECKGTYNDENFLIYINAATGKEEKILMLIESEEGILTV